MINVLKSGHPHCSVQRYPTSNQMHPWEETRRRWCQVQSALARRVRGLERHSSLRGGHGKGPAPWCELHLSGRVICVLFLALLAPKPDLCGPPGWSARKPRAFNKLFIYFIWIKCIWLSATNYLALLLRLDYSGQMLMRTHLLMLFWVLWCLSDPSTSCERVLILNFI